MGNFAAPAATSFAPVGKGGTAPFKGEMFRLISPLKIPLSATKRGNCGSPFWINPLRGGKRLETLSSGGDGGLLFFHGGKSVLLLDRAGDLVPPPGVLLSLAGASGRDTAQMCVTAVSWAVEASLRVGPVRAGAGTRRVYKQVEHSTIKAWNAQRQRAATHRPVKFPPAPDSSAKPGFVVPRKWGSGDDSPCQGEMSSKARQRG